MQLPSLLLQGDCGSWFVGLDSELFAWAAANFASSPAGLAMMVLSLSSPSLSLFKVKVHSSYSDIVLSGRPRASRGGAVYVDGGK